MTGKSSHITWFLILATACGKQASEDHAHHVDHDGTKIAQAISENARPANQVVLSSQKTIKPSRKLAEKALTANGYIAFDERRNYKVALRTSGRIEKLYIKYNYQYVKKGEQIAEVYSPELSTYQEEYLFLLKSGEDVLVVKAKEKLKLLGLSESQIQQTERSAVATHTVNITSPIDGFIRFPLEPVSSGEMNASSSTGMGAMAEAPSSSAGALVTSGVQIREGMYVNKGQTLFVVNDCLQVWAILSVDISSQVELKKGAPVTLTSEVQSEPVKASIDLVEFAYKDKQRFTQARIYLDNPGRKFKINSLIKGEFLIHTQGLMVPLSSVYDLGSRKIVWIRTGTTSNGIGLFEPKVVMTGIASNNSIEIITGLTGDEEIALDAGFMLDSESILNEDQ